MNPKILYVEDFEPAAVTMSYIADELGYDCTCVSSGQEALDIIAKNTFDLILLDIKLPDMDGDVLAQQIRGSTNAPIIGFTGETGNITKERAAAFDGLKQKSFNLDDIKKTLQDFLKK